MTENPDVIYWFKEYQFLEELVEKIRERLLKVTIFEDVETQKARAADDIYKMIKEAWEVKEKRQKEHAEQLLKTKS